MSFKCQEYIERPEINGRMDRAIFWHLKFLMWCNHDQCAWDAAADIKEKFMMGCLAGFPCKDEQHFWNLLRQFVAKGCMRYPRGWPSSCLYREIPRDLSLPWPAATTSDADSPPQAAWGIELIKIVEEECGRMGIDGRSTWMFLNGHTYGEISLECNCTQGTARVQVHRGRSRLAVALHARGVI